MPQSAASADGVHVQRQLPGWLSLTQQWTTGSRSCSRSRGKNSSRSRNSNSGPPLRQAQPQQHRRCQLPAWTPRTGRRSPRRLQCRLHSRRRRLCSSKASQPLPMTPPQQRIPLCETLIVQHKTWVQSHRQPQQALHPSSHQCSSSRCRRRRRQHRRQRRRMRSNRRASSGASPGSATPLRTPTAATSLPGASPRYAPHQAGIT
jgi:hypothetical protein